MSNHNNNNEKLYRPPPEIKMDPTRSLEEHRNSDRFGYSYENALTNDFQDDFAIYRDKAIHKSSYGWEDSTDSRRFTERRKKTVRFDGQDGSQTFPRAAIHQRARDSQMAHDWATVRWECDRQGSQDSATKDSGIDTSSTFTSSEDSNRGDPPKVQPTRQATFSL